MFQAAKEICNNHVYCSVFGAIYSFCARFIRFCYHIHWLALVRCYSVWYRLNIVVVCDYVLQQFTRDPVVPLQYYHPDNYDRALIHLCDDVYKKTKGKSLDLLIAILPDNNGPLYGMLRFLFLSNRLKLFHLSPDDLWVMLTLA